MDSESELDLWFDELFCPDVILVTHFVLSSCVSLS